MNSRRVIISSMARIDSVLEINATHEFGEDPGVRQEEQHAGYPHPEEGLLCEELELVRTLQPHCLRTEPYKQ